MTLSSAESINNKKNQAEQYARPTKEQLEIASLEEDLEHAQNEIYCLEKHIKMLKSKPKKRITYSENEIDKLFEQRNQIIKTIRKVVTDKDFSDGLFKDEILRIMEWKR